MFLGLETQKMIMTLLGKGTQMVEALLAFWDGRSENIFLISGSIIIMKENIKLVSL